jgi:hypothetical protein
VPDEGPPAEPVAPVEELVEPVVEASVAPVPPV